MKHTDRKTTTISFEGNKNEVRALRFLALERDVTVGRLVRDALLAHYPSFFESSGAKKRQSSVRKTANK